MAGYGTGAAAAAIETAGIPLTMHDFEAVCPRCSRPFGDGEVTCLVCGRARLMHSVTLENEGLPLPRTDARERTERFSLKTKATIGLAGCVAKMMKTLCDVVSPTRYQGLSKETTGALAIQQEWYPMFCCLCQNTCMPVNTVLEALGDLQPHPAPYLAIRAEGLPVSNELLLRPYSQVPDVMKQYKMLDEERAYEGFGEGYQPTCDGAPVPNAHGLGNNQYDLDHFRSPTGYGNQVDNERRWVGAGQRPYGQATTRAYDYELPVAEDIIKEISVRRQDPTGKNQPVNAPTNTNALLAWLAGVAIHDFFRTDSGRGGDGLNPRENINLQSSYLDLSPLYGFDMEQQEDARECSSDPAKMGKLKADYICDPRLYALPGSLALIALFRRHHNYICDELRKAYPDGLERLPGQPWTDELLFQQARLITTGSYVNLLLRDYAGGIQGYWNNTDNIGVPELRTLKHAKGFVCSYEFLLLYNFHATIPDYYTPPPFMMAMFKKEEEKRAAKEAGIVPEPTPVVSEETATREAAIKAAQQKQHLAAEFGSVDDQSAPNSADDAVVKHLYDALTHPSGAFNPFNNPSWKDFAMWRIDASMLERGRKHKVGTFNDMRTLMGYPRFTKFEEFNETDSRVAEILRKHYRHVDDVELMIGHLVAPPGDGGWGAPGTLLSVAILSDAFSSVRQDRFHTTCFNEEYYTEWGYNLAKNTHVGTLVRLHTDPAAWAAYGIDVDKIPKKGWKVGKVQTPETLGQTS